MGVLGILGAPLLVILGWLFSIHGRISKLEGINEGKILAKEQSPLTLTDVAAQPCCVIVVVKNILKTIKKPS